MLEPTNYETDYRSYKLSKIEFVTFSVSKLHLGNPSHT